MHSSFYKKLENPQRLAVLDLVDYYGKGLYITRINVPGEHRRKGIATELMKECCAEADKEKVTLWLEIFASGSMSYTDLADWYTRSFGFKEVVTGMYRRKPK